MNYRTGDKFSVSASRPKKMNSCHVMKKNRLFILPVIAALALSLADARAATLFPVVVGDHWGFADKSGKLVINPQFERAEPFVSGLAEVRLDKWGYVNVSGKMVVSPQFDKTGPFSDGLAAVVVGGRCGYVNPEGKYVVNPQFDAARNLHRRSRLDPAQPPFWLH